MSGRLTSAISTANVAMAGQMRVLSLGQRRRAGELLSAAPSERRVAAPASTISTGRGNRRPPSHAAAVAGAADPAAPAAPSRRRGR
jgi:hypothetical protein